jgi:hypothetical protein
MPYMRPSHHGGIKLTMDGTNPPPPGTTNPVTRSRGPHGRISS